MPTSQCSNVNRPTIWQDRFTALLPEIDRLLRIAFRDLTPEARADAVEEGIIHCLLSYGRLFEQGRAESVTASNLAWYAMLQVRRGRTAGWPVNSKEPLSRYAQITRGFEVEPLRHDNSGDERWINDVVDSRRISVADQVAMKLDLLAWLGSLGRRTRSIAVDLARGFTTSEVGRKYRVTPGRIAQMRRELKRSWDQFQGEPALVVSA